VKLTDLEPRWIHPNVFVFLCPHCQKVYLSCKNVQMPRRDQWQIFKKEFGDNWNDLVISTLPDMAWSITGTRPDDPKQAFIGDLTVAPSLDASKAGHWHGFIRNGEII
jgi:hypothetical protein